MEQLTKKEWIGRYLLHRSFADPGIGGAVERIEGAVLTPTDAVAKYLEQLEFFTIEGLDETGEWKGAQPIYDTEVGWCWYPREDDFFVTFEEAGEFALKLRRSCQSAFRVMDRNGVEVPILYSVQYTNESVDQKRIPCRTFDEAKKAFDVVLSQLIPGQIVLIWDEIQNCHVKGTKMTDSGDVIDMPF